MKAQVKLGRLFGIEIGLHYSWIIIALLITFSLVGHFTVTNPQWDNTLVWAAAIITGLLFFATLVAHELAHSLVARLRGLPVRSITLFALGGLAQIEREAADPKTEFWMGIAGPIMSVIIGLICLGIARALGWTPMMDPHAPVQAVLVWLGYINIALAVFNMIPGFPLDGGRVLRAIIWWATGNGNRSTRIAARVGQGVAFFFIILGLVQFFRGEGFGGLWIAFIGWFLLEAARASYAQVEISEGLRGVRVADVMARDCQLVDSRTNLQTFVDEHLLRSGRRCFVVVESGGVAGLITPHEVKGVDRARWPYTLVTDVMRPIDKLRTVSPETPVTQALETMGRDDVNQLPVVSDGRLEGVISRGHVLGFLQNRAELNM
jgi:Zn-dependent protease/CBS domain-containing protein